MNALRGHSLVANPGHGLTARELGVILLYGEGATTAEIEKATGMTSAMRADIEVSARAKLGARTPPHMIAKAFSLGVLATRALCLLLAILSADYHDAMRNRTPMRTGRPGAVVMRIKTGSRNLC